MKINDYLYADFLADCKAIDRRPDEVLEALAYYFHSRCYPDVPSLTYTPYPDSFINEIDIPRIVKNVVKVDNLSVESFVYYLMGWFIDMSKCLELPTELVALLNIFAPFKD